MKRVLIGIALFCGLAVLVLAGVLAYARGQVQGKLSQQIKLAPVEVPVPWPLTEEEEHALRMERWEEDDHPPDAEPEVGGPGDPLAGADLEAVAMERAVERADRLVNVLLGCTECHGADWGGMVVMDVPPVMTMVAPNLTPGKGGLGDVSDGEIARVLRHGINPDGTPSLMPAVDYAMLSDRELSDIVAYLRTREPVDREMQDSTTGPVIWLTFGLGDGELSYEVIDHDAERAKVPPKVAPNVAYGAHITQVCVGCHGQTLAGGPIAGGDPSWPESANLTPHDSGLSGWTAEDFKVAMREGKRPDGTDIDPAMPWEMMSAMTDTELEAVFLYLQSLEPLPKGAR